VGVHHGFANEQGKTAGSVLSAVKTGIKKYNARLARRGVSASSSYEGTHRQTDHLQGSHLWYAKGKWDSFIHFTNLSVPY
jgi:hypothetical protein